MSETTLFAFSERQIQEAEGLGHDYVVALLHAVGFCVEAVKLYGKNTINLSKLIRWIQANSREDQYPESQGGLEDYQFSHVAGTDVLQVKMSRTWRANDEYTGVSNEGQLRGNKFTDDDERDDDERDDDDDVENAKKVNNVEIADMVNNVEIADKVNNVEIADKVNNVEQDNKDIEEAGHKGNGEDQGQKKLEDGVIVSSTKTKLKPATTVCLRLRIVGTIAETNKPRFVLSSVDVHGKRNAAKAENSNDEHSLFFNFVGLEAVKVGLVFDSRNGQRMREAILIEGVMISALFGDGEKWEETIKFGYARSVFEVISVFAATNNRMAVQI